MSTTVTYKGETLTTVDNATVTLNTAGKYCEDDFTLTDVSGGGVAMGSVTVEYNDGDYMCYTDDTMTVVTVSSGNMDLIDEPMPVGSIFVIVREGMAPPAPFPMSVSGATKLAEYTVGSKGIVRIYKVT